MYFFYSLVLTVGFLLLLPRFLYDAARKGKYAAGFWQRLGYLPDFENEGKPIVWLHAVSVGETQAARPLAKALLENFSNYRLVVSTTTKTGQKLAREIFKNQAILVFYFPFDWRFVVRRVLRKIKPEAVLIMETELWFNFLREAKSQNVKIALVNGRLSEKSFKNYSLIRRFMKKVLANLDLALMSGDRDARRIVELGCESAKVFITGNVKFDLQQEESELTKVFRNRFAINKARPLIVAASTHAPEERWILDAYLILCKKMATNLPRLLLVPRHPERFVEVANLIKTFDLSFVRRSAGATEADKRADVILLDSIGELRAVYPLAETVFVGGSLIPHGGQNILEPAAARKAIVTGFYTMNFTQLTREFLLEKAIVQLPELKENEISANLAEVLAELLTDAERKRLLSENAFAVLQKNRGATKRTIKLLEQILFDAER